MWPRPQSPASAGGAHLRPGLLAPPVPSLPTANTMAAGVVLYEYVRTGTATPEADLGHWHMGPTPLLIREALISLAPNPLIKLSKLSQKPVN